MHKNKLLSTITVNNNDSVLIAFIMTISIGLTIGVNMHAAAQELQRWEVFIGPDANVSESIALSSTREFFASLPKAYRQDAVNIEASGPVLDFRSLSADEEFNGLAIATTIIESDIKQHLSLGVGADWWMAIYLNDRLKLDTSQSGNMYFPIASSNYHLRLDLQPGRNDLVIVVRSGSDGWQLHTKLSSGDIAVLDSRYPTKAAILHSNEQVGEALKTGWADHIAEVKRRLEEGRPTYVAAHEQLLAEAELSLLAGPFSVAFDNIATPRGDPRDYFSYALYWWPNPNTPDGLPYIRRDGVIAPKTQEGDRVAHQSLCTNIETLSLAYAIEGDERYAEKAINLLRVFFINPTTRMNPHLRYAQGVPGKSEGRSFGMINFHRLPMLIRALQQLDMSPAMTDEIRQELSMWMDELLGWMLNDAYGQQIADYYNNHSSNYDAMISSLAIYTGRAEIARVATARSAERLLEQIEPDGKQPHELKRSKSVSYMRFNLRHLITAAEYGQLVGIDTASTGEHAERLRAACNLLMDYIESPNHWSYQQIEPVKPELMIPVLRRAALLLNDPDIEMRMRRLFPNAWRSNRVNLIWPTQFD